MAFKRYYSTICKYISYISDTSGKKSTISSNIGLHNIYYFNVDCGKNTIDFIMFFVLML